MRVPGLLEFSGLLREEYGRIILLYSSRNHHVPVCTCHSRAGPTRWLRFLTNGVVCAAGSPDRAVPRHHSYWKMPLAGLFSVFDRHQPLPRCKGGGSGTRKPRIPWLCGAELNPHIETIAPSPSAPSSPASSSTHFSTQQSGSRCSSASPARSGSSARNAAAARSATTTCQRPCNRLPRMRLGTGTR